MPKKTDPELDRMAEEIFDLIKVASVARARSRTGSPEELTEAEFLALDALMQRGPLSVGDIQKRIGVLPAQMSRIIRSLESKGGDAFVTCGINPKDRRKIDVTIAPEGVNAANHAFDVTPARLISGLITERGVTDASEAGLRRLYPEKG